MGSLTLPTRTRDPALGKDKEAATSSQETEPDTQGHAKDSRPPVGSLTLPHGDSDLSTVDRQGRHHQQSQDSSRHSRTGHGSGNSKHREASVSQASDSEGQSLDSETQSGSVQERSRSSQRRQRGSSAHGSSEHSASYFYQVAPQEHFDSAHGQSQSSTRGRQGPRHDQAHDNTRHSGSHEGQAADLGHSESGSRHQQSSTRAQGSRPSQARQGQSSSEFRPVSNRGSSISQDSDSEGLTEDSERQYGSGSGNQQGSARGHAGDSARHSESQQRHRTNHGQSQSGHGQSDTGTGRRQGSSHGHSLDTSRLPGSHRAGSPSRGHADSVPWPVKIEHRRKTRNPA